MFWQIVGILAAIMTMFSFVPQIIKVMANKSAKDVSIVTLSQLSGGVLLWVIYGIYRKDLIIITANIVTLASLLVLINLYLRYKRS